MTDDSDAIAIVKDFLDTHYRDEPSDVRALISSLEMINQSLEIGDRVAKAFRTLFGADLAPGVLRDIVLDHACRDAADDDEARTLLETIYTTNVLDCLG